MKKQIELLASKFINYYNEQTTGVRIMYSTVIALTIEMLILLALLYPLGMFIMIIVPTLSTIITYCLLEKSVKK